MSTDKINMTKLTIYKKGGVVIANIVPICGWSQRRSGSLLVSRKGTAAEYVYTPPAEHLHLHQIPP
jgi:hypothetical protein